MMDDVVTLYCRVGDPKQERFVRRVVRGVSFTGGPARQMGVPLTEASDRALLLLPLAGRAEYRTPQQWRAAGQAVEENAFTVQVGDVFACGELPETDTPPALLARGEGWCVSSVTQRAPGSTLAHLTVGAGRLYTRGGGVL